MTDAVFKRNGPDAPVSDRIAANAGSGRVAEENARQIDGLDLLITAAEAYPALERAFLAAEREIRAGFRVFDLRMPLRSAEGLAIGDTWFDLMRHTLARGVAVHFVIADFDPLLAPDLHRGTWRSVRQFTIAREATDGARLAVHADLHPAKVGWLTRLLLWPVARRKLAKHLRRLRRMTPSEREGFLIEAPGLAQHVAIGADGAVRSAMQPVPPYYPATHHQKLAVFDRTRLFIGGLDVNQRRYDDPHHRRPAAQTWHDVSCMVDGATVSDAQGHLEHFWRAPPDKGNRDGTAFIRTVSTTRRWPVLSMSPEVRINEIEHGTFRLIGQARTLLYFETQFFRHLPLANALARAARANPSLGLIMMLPAAPEDVAFEQNSGRDARFGEYLQARCIAKVRRAFGQRQFIGAATQPRHEDTQDRDTAMRAPLVYIHSKISVADDAVAMVTSANLNGRSMRWDTEAGVRVDDEDTVREMRRRLFAHWLGADAPAELHELKTAVAAWRDRAAHNAKAKPEDRMGFIVPYDVRPARRFGRKVPLAPEEIV